MELISVGPFAVVGEFPNALCMQWHCVVGGPVQSSVNASFVIRLRRYPSGLYSGLWLYCT